MTYRRYFWDQQWHSAHLCTEWPLTHFVQSDGTEVAKVCEECERYQRVEHAGRAHA
ncbi:MAG TPA: hypothetical protein VHB46_19395 [Burkholderiales bacterium]|nr:hypothetical protein [Burkholderiales bacterium]